MTGKAIGGEAKAQAIGMWNAITMAKARRKDLAVLNEVAG